MERKRNQRRVRNNIGGRGAETSSAVGQMSCRACGGRSGELLGVFPALKREELSGRKARELYVRTATDDAADPLDAVIPSIYSHLGQGFP